MTSSNGNVSALLAICVGNLPVPHEFPAQRPVPRSFDVFVDLVWINGWVNNREAGDLRRYRVHFDVIVTYYKNDLQWLEAQLSRKVTESSWLENNYVWLYIHVFMHAVILSELGKSTQNNK